MNTFQSGKNRNIDKQFSGCFGITKNLFDVSAGLAAAGSTMLLTDKSHHDGSSFSRSRSDVTTMVDHLNANRVDNKKIMSKTQKSSSIRKSTGTPMKMLIAQEMSKEVTECKPKSSTNLVAKLMGLDPLPNQKGSTQHNRSKSLSGIPIKFPQHGRSYSQSDEYSCYNDIYDKWQKSTNEKETPNEKKVDLVCQKEFQDAVEVLSSNRDIFLKFLQDPNSLVPSLPKTKRITILKPAKMIDGAKFSKDNSPEDEDANDIQPTRIVVLRPGHGDKLSQEEDDRVQASKEMATGHRRDEILLSPSVFSNGYIGDDSSFNMSDTEFADGNLSDSEALSPISTHSLDFFNSHHSVSSYSQATYTPESSVCREAKRRLSERWALMASTDQTTFVEQGHVRTSSSTLGEMLSLSEEVNGNDKDKDRKGTPRELSRSKSLPSSSTVFSDRLNGELLGSGEEQNKKTSGKSSSKWSISSLFFSRSKKSRKENSGASQFEDKAPSKGGEASESMVNPHEKVLNHLNENLDHPSPISVLDQLFEEDDNAFPGSSGKNISSQLLRSNLLDKSPRIESVARTLSWDDDCFGSPSPHLVKPLKSKEVIITEEEKQDWLDFIQKVIFLASPLDPSIRNTLCSQYDKEQLPEAKKRQMRSNRKLVFDCVSDTIIESADMAGSGTQEGIISAEMVWGRMESWFLDEGSCVCREEEEEEEEEEEGDMIRLVVERVVRNEVVGKRWVELLRLEIDNLGLEMERKLLEEALDEAVVDLVLGRVL